MKKIHHEKNSPLQQRKANRWVFSILLMMIMLTGMHSAMAQNHYTADDFRWEYSSVSSSCENNGRLIYIVINKVTGDTLNFVQGANPADGGVCTMPDGTSFKLGSFQFRKQGSTEAFMSSPSSTTTASFAPGVYEVKWGAQMYNVGEVVPVPIGVSTTTLIEVQNAYLPSTLNLVGQATAENSVMYGGRPSLPGQNTGRVQFQVTNPNFPLHFVITDSQNDIVLDKVLNGPMYSGSDAHRYDFATYYTFDSLAAGNYSLLLEDGCHKTNPSYAFEIREVRAPIMTDISFNSTPPSYTDSNVVRFYSARLSVDADVWDYLSDDYQGYLQYRVCYGDIDTSDWKPFPIHYDKLIRNSDYSYSLNYNIYDTIHSLSSYCPLYGQYLTFQYRCTIPGQEDTVTRYTKILEKYRIYESTSDSVSYDQNEVVYDACSYRIPSVHEYTAKNRYSYTGSYNEYMTSSIPYSSTTTAEYFTEPFTWKMIDTLTQETVKTQRTNHWGSWEITKSEMEALYGPISDTTIKFPVKIVVTDAKNCPVATQPDVIMYDHVTSADAYRYVNCSYSQYINEYSTYSDVYRCCQAPTGIHIYEVISNNTFGNNESGLLAMPDPNRFKYMRDGMQIKVTRSPYENKYNFTATYSFDRNEWDVVWENEDHGDVVTSVYENNNAWDYNFGITVEENCFPYGYYAWELITDCDTRTGTYLYPYGKEVIERTEDLSFTAEQNCMEMYIQLTGGEFSRVKLGADIEDPMQTDEIWLNNPTILNTYVKVLGDSTGHDNRDYRVKDHPTIRLTKPGTYTLRMYTLDTSEYCRTEYFDTTISYESGALYYEQNPTAFVCDAGGDTKGFVFCKVTGGMAPYTYSLYNANNDLLETNRTGEFLNIPNVHQNDQLTLYVSDSCGWSATDSSIVMRDFKSSIVVWYNDESGDHQTSGPSTALKSVAKCEGTEITVNVSSINDLFTYHWYNGDHSFDVMTSEAKVLIPRDAEATTYYVNVEFTDCSAGFTDSIFVDVIRVPEVTITPNSNMVCPGEEVQLTFTPTNPNASPTGDYVIGRENNSVITFIPYSDLQEHNFSYTATSPNRFWVHSVSDATCTYTIPEDTVLISLREMTSSCDVTVSSDTVCYGGEITLTASSPTLGSAYTVKWYDSPTQDNILKEENITTSGASSTYTLSDLLTDTSIYVTVADALHCETYSGTVQRWLNMGDSTSVHMSCGESIRLFDSGGSAQGYSAGEKDTITFSSLNLNNRITLSFNSLNLIGNDKLYIYTGATANTDSLIATLSGNNTHSEISSNSNAMTLRFRSDLTDQAEGWDAVVGCSARPAEAKVHVLDDLDVALTVSPSLPARYGHAIDVTATAHGGKGTNYQYVWEESTDNQTWSALTVAPVIDGVSNTYSYAALNESKYVKVTVTDASGTPCPGDASDVIYLEVSNILLSLELSSDADEICQETFVMSVDVKNEGGETATGVSVKPNLPANMVLVNPADTIILIGDVDGGTTVTKTFNVRNEIQATTNTVTKIQAQIWTCDQGDGESVFQNWDWTRTLLENDEDEHQVTIRPSMPTAKVPGAVVAPVSVCYGQDATLIATPTISEPVYYTWYADAALTEVVSTTDTYVAQQIADPRTYYVLAYNDQYCPAAATVNHVIKLQYAVNDTLLMHNGTMQVGNNDHIRFYDDGGPNGNSTAASYTFLFTSVDGSPLEIYFEGNQDFYTNALAIYDGNSVMGTNLNANEQITDGSAFTASSGMMLVKYSSPNNDYNGFSAHVFTTTRPAVAEAVATSRIGDAQTITATDAVVCYGDDAMLSATSTVAAPQTFTWFAPDRLTVVHTETIDNAGEPSTYTIPSPQQEGTYYVTVVGEGGCPFVPQIHNNYREMRFDDTYDYNQNIAPSDSVCLYDAGGKDGSCQANGNWPRGINFEGPEGSRVHLHVNSMDGQQGYGRLEVRVSDSNGQDYYYYIYCTDGIVTDTDFVSMNNRMYVLYYPGSNGNSYSGLDAYLYVESPIDTSNYAKAKVSFKTPSFTPVNTTGSDAYCYGTQAALEASVENNTDELRYVWYDKYYNVLFEQTGVTSTYQPVVTAEATYYVNASAMDQCPVLPPDYVIVLMNEAANGGVRNLAEGEAVHFYDEGGPNGNYSTYNNNNGGWTYTFKAPAGKRVKMELYNFHGACSEYLSIYDGTPSNSQNIGGYSCTQDYLNRTLYAESGTMTVRWQNYTSSTSSAQKGWDALVGVEDGMGRMNVHEVSMDSVKVTLIPPVSPSLITTQDDEVCFGNEATLKASISNEDVDFPQFYTWYSPDRMTVLLRDTISSGQSQYTFTPEQEDTYYVSVAGEGDCPIVESIHNQYGSDIWFISNNSGNNEKMLTENNIYRIYDDGGPDGEYSSTSENNSSNSYKYFYTNIANSQIKIHFDTIALADSKARLKIQHSYGNYQTIFEMRGPNFISDTDIVANATRIQIDFYKNSGTTNTAGGFAGYVHAITPYSLDGLAPVSVTFADPTVNNITVADVEACFGNEAELVATSTGISAPQVFAWFDTDYNVLKLDTVSDGQSTFPSQVLGNATYYVNAVERGSCPVLPPYYGSIFLNANTTGGSYTLAEGEAVPFYDEGGPNGNYSTYVPSDAPWTYTFKAPAGKQVTVNVISRNTSNAELMVYDGTIESNSGEQYYCYTGNTYVSTTGMMTFRWYTYSPMYPYAGFDILVGVKDSDNQMTTGNFGLVSANVTVKQPTSGLDLVTSDATVCYGNEASLTAKATAETQSLLGYPQYFTWYSPDGRTLLLKDTVDGVTKTYSEFTAPGYYQYQDQNYYVSVGNADNCPAVLAPITTLHTVHLNSAVHNQTTLLSASDAAKFYDAAEGSNYYQDHNSDYTHTFQTLQGNLLVKFYEADNYGIREGDTLYIYDAATADNAAIIGKVGYMEDEDDYASLSFTSTGKYLTFRFESVTTWGSDGWEALIMPVNQQADMDTAKVFITATSVPETAITMYSDTICLGEEAEVSASADLEYPQYYIWYDSEMQELLRDTLHNASESPSVLSLPAHYADAVYYAMVYSDTVSCVMSTIGLPRAYSELPLTASMDGLETQLAPNDSIRVFTPTAINRTGSDNYYYDYYFTAEEGVIQIHFDEIVMSGGYMELSDDEMDMEYAGYSAGTYHDVTITSLRNSLHLEFSREIGNPFSFDATVINIASSTEILSKMEQVDVTVKLSAATANVVTTNDTVCYGSPALLTASSSDPVFPQIYTWYNSDVDEVLLSDTIYSGASSLYIPGQLGTSTYYVFMNNENNTCPLAFVDNHDNFREYLFTEDMNNTTLFVGAVDSLVVYDDGGKNGNYSVVVNDAMHINILKLQTYPGSTIHVEVPTLDTDPEYTFFVFGEPDTLGNLDLEDESRLMMYAGQMSGISYNSLTNILYLGWVYYGSEDAEEKPGFEAVFTAQMHPENQLTAAKAVMNTLPYMSTLALTADPHETTICQGDDLELTSTTSLTDYPQYFVWYNSDFTSVLATDTVQLGNEGHATISNLTQDTVVYAAVGTDDMCPAYPMDHKFNIQELRLTAPISGDTTILSLIDSVLFYDEGGPSNNYNSENVIWYHTFKASNPDAHVIIHFKDINLDTKCSSDNWLVVVQGPLDFEDRDNNDFLHEPFQGTHSDVTLVSDGDSLTVVWGSKCWDSQRRGWEAYVFTDEEVMNIGVDVFDSTTITVNPSYQYTMYDSVFASTIQLYDVDRFHGIDISVPGDYTIDSVYSTTLGCDSTYSLKLHVRANADDVPPCIGCDSTAVNPTDPTEGVSCTSIGSQNVQPNNGTTYVHADNRWNVTATDENVEVLLTYKLIGATTEVTAPNNTLNGQVFNEGVTTVRWIAADAAGNADSCEFTVTVDNSNPCIGCDSMAVNPTDPTEGVSCTSIGSQSVQPNNGTTYVHADNSWNITATDNDVEVSLTYKLIGATTEVTAPNNTLNGQVFNEGVTTVRWIAADAAGNADSCEFTVTVDNSNPCIGCDSTAVDPTDPTAGVSCTSIGSQNVQPNNGTTYVHADNRWNVTATDENVEVLLTYKLIGATTEVTAPNNTLNGQVFNEGVTTVRWIAADAAGNADSCEFTVTVDNSNPCIGCDSTAANPTDPTAGVSCTSIGSQNVQPNNGTTYVHTDNRWNVTATDENVEVLLTYKLIGATTEVTAPNNTLNGQVFNEGVTTVRWIAADAAGNADSCEFTVTVDPVKPNAKMPADTTLCRNSLTGAIEAPTSVTGEPTNLSDNCTSVGNLTVYSIDTDTTGTDNGLRVIHREWHVKDICNNDSVKVQNITIRPSVLTENNITFTCPDTTITLKYGVCDTLIELERTLINNMSDMTVSLDSIGIPSNHRYNVESSPYTITWRVTDECGSYVEYTQNVTVLFPPCGPGVTAIDGDGIAYPTVQVGCNCWTARNARSTRYANDNALITPTPMQYPGTENHPEDTIYGKLYTYNAATRIPLMRNVPTQVQGICPNGWHMPDDADFADLMEHWEGIDLNTTERWITPGTNLSGFAMEPGGRYNEYLDRFEYLLARGYLCSYTPGAITIVHACEFGYACSTVEIIQIPMPTGVSVRCVHDAE